MEIVIGVLIVLLVLGVVLIVGALRSEAGILHAFDPMFAFLLGFVILLVDACGWVLWLVFYATWRFIES